MRVWVFGDDVDTDQMISGRYLAVKDPKEMASRLFEDVRPEFAAGVRPGDVIKAGVNFGCGSSRENVATAFIAAGVSCVIAEGFSRTFFRNCINLGLPLVRIDPGADIREGDDLTVHLDGGRIVNNTRGAEYRFKPLPDFLINIVRAGGLLPYVKKNMQRG